MSETLQRRLCVRLYDSDAEFLQNMSRTTGIGFNRLVRETLHKIVIQLRDQERQNIDNLPSPNSLGIEIDLDLLDSEAAQ